MEEEVSQVDEFANPWSEFPPQVSQDIEGIRHLGALFDPQIDFCGHTFGLRTLKTGEELAASVVVQPYRNTLKEPEAWISALVGLALTHVDGDEEFCPPVGPDPDQYAVARFRYVQRWFYPTLDFLYQKFVALQERQIEAIRAVQDLSPRNLPPSLPLVDFWSEQGISPGETPTEIPDSA